LKPGEALLEQYRAAGKPVPPSLQRMAAMLDKMEEENNAQVSRGSNLASKIILRCL
jgi:hypothetical protein